MKYYYLLFILFINQIIDICEMRKKLLRFMWISETRHIKFCRSESTMLSTKYSSDSIL